MAETTETLDSLKSGIASGRLSGCTRLKLADNLSSFPTEILALAASLTFLNLSNNNLSHLPPEFAQLKQLKIVFFNSNHFETFPTVLAQCPQLSMVSFKNNQIKSIKPQALSPCIRWLILTNNQLSSLPTTIGQLPNLQKLMLAGNQLHALPSELAYCKNLELIRISENRIETLPAWLLSMPRLAWLAYAGNPCHPVHTTHQNSTQPDQSTIQTINSSDLQQKELIGEGASGFIHKGIWTPSNPPKENFHLRSQPPALPSQTVAIKYFKGNITSDGSPLDEMKACIAAGEHPNLVTVLGKYRHENESEKKGLIFSYLSSDYKNLGNPPSLESCTRDTYNQQTAFTLTEALRVAKGIASAAQHLHSRNIMHGDLYAHNILINQTGHSILGDFGAASFYDPATVGQRLEKIEIRAFGCLLEDLLSHLATSESQKKSNKTFNTYANSLEALEQLTKNCLQPAVEKRPLFAEVTHLVDKLFAP